MMDNKLVAEALRQRAQALLLAAKIVSGQFEDGVPVGVTVGVTEKTGKRKMSAEALRKIRLGQQKRRARERKEARDRQMAIESTTASELAA